jgi:hypothetical protein
MRNSSLLMMVVVGWLGELLRDSAGPCGYAESTFCRGMARLGGDCTSSANGQGGHVGIFSALRSC